MANNFYRGTWAEVDLDAIRYNVEQMKQRLSGKSEIIAVVKANAYGHGAIQVARAALQAGAKALGVALLEEAIALRKAGITVPILVFGWVSAEDAPLAAENDITITFFQKEWLREVKQYPLEKDLKVHMKWDTGMGRIGVRTEDELRELLQEFRDVNKNYSIHLTGVFTHFATADESDLSYFEHQYTAFEKLLHVFHQVWSEPVDIHIGNSAAAIRFPEKMRRFIRFGISMYGLYPSQTVKREHDIDLHPSFSLHSRMTNVKEVPPGESISYGATYTTSEREWIGTIPIGYADGWIRKLQGMDVLVDGKRMPIVGRICMDQTMIRLDREYAVGTKATLIGEQDGNRIEMDEIATYLDTINYEIPCIISNRVPRVYKGET